MLPQRRQTYWQHFLQSDAAKGARRALDAKKNDWVKQANRVYDVRARVFAFVGKRRGKIQLLRQKDEIFVVPAIFVFSKASGRPKPGGGYGENYEIRQYRPGDNLNQIHWKLSAKVGDLMLREPM
ncbi:MAG: DUF58 domain-containing protein, partial [Lentisphaeria bacterium]|nr:DUF58 domain-containing protein [Lentisphaeria bacterium]